MTRERALVYSATVGNNAELFPEILRLYARPGWKIADTTYGQGVFWRNIPVNRYRLHATDLATGVDARALPYADGSMDMVVFDPPYMHGSGAAPHQPHENMERYYKNAEHGPRGKGSAGAYHRAVVDLYLAAAKEALRVLRPMGVYVVKCQDEVSANRQCLTHVELINELGELGFVCEDLFVMVRTNLPSVSTMETQVHARKAHSYALVLVKNPERRIWHGPADPTP